MGCVWRTPQFVTWGRGKRGTCVCKCVLVHARACVHMQITRMHTRQRTHARTHACAATCQASHCTHPARRLRAAANIRAAPALMAMTRVLNSLPASMRLVPE